MDESLCVSWQLASFLLGIVGGSLITYLIMAARRKS